MNLSGFSADVAAGDNATTAAAKYMAYATAMAAAMPVRLDSSAPLMPHVRNMTNRSAPSSRNSALDAPAMP